MIRAAEQLRVLGQLARLQLIELLAEGPQSPQQLAQTLGLSQQNVSKHLQVLHSVGLLTRRREGSRVLYALADEGVITLLDQMVRRVTQQLAELSRMAGDPLHRVDDDNKLSTIVGMGG